MKLLKSVFWLLAVALLGCETGKNAVHPESWVYYLATGDDSKAYALLEERIPELSALIDKTYNIRLAVSDIKMIGTAQMTKGDEEKSIGGSIGAESDYCLVEYFYDKTPYMYIHMVDKEGRTLIVTPIKEEMPMIYNSYTEISLFNPAPNVKYIAGYAFFKVENSETDE